MSGYPQKAYNALVSGFFKCLNCSVFGEDSVSVLFSLDIVKLPAIEVIGLQPLKAPLQQTHGTVISAIMRFSCQVHLVAPIFQY
jgi:hypothetical protein